MPFSVLLHVVFRLCEFHIVSHVGLEVLQVVGMSCPMVSLLRGRKREVRRRTVEVEGRLNVECLKFLLGIKTCRVYLSLK